MSDDENLAANLIVSEAIIPMLKALEGEVAEPVNYALYLIDGESLKLLDSFSDEAVNACAEVRLLLNQGFDEGSYKFLAECIIKNFAKDTGYSGFSMKGKCSTTDNSLKVSTKSNRYNVWDWGSKFRVN